MAAMASTTGTARGSTHASCLPLAFNTVGVPSSVTVSCSAQECGNRFECHPEINVLTVADASLYAAAMVGSGGNSSVVVDEHVVLFASPLGHAGKSLSILESFHGVDAEHGSAQTPWSLPNAVRPIRPDTL